MNYYSLANAIVSGICLGFGILFLFTGVRRRDNRRLSLLFAIFALAYAGTLFNGIRFHNATTVELYVAINRRDSIFVVLAYTALIWYVAEYTQVKPRLLLWGLTAVLIISGIANIVRTNLIYDQILDLNTITMPWGEQVAYLEATDSVWSLLFLAAQLAVLTFMVLACILQYRRGERSEALILSTGALWFVAALAAEILGEVGVLPQIFYGEFGFLGFVIAMSLQMSNEAIKSDEQLAAYRMNLEELVKERTVELEETQEELLKQTKKDATEVERSRIARDLHDAVTQTIYSAALIAEVLPAVWERSPDEGRRNLAKLRQLVRGALAEMRTLLFELRPNSLAIADVEVLIQQLSDAFTSRTRTPVEVQVDTSVELPAEVKITLYRITQEAFNNIIKYAHSEKVIVSLRQNPEQVILTVEDDGHGFDPDKITGEQMGLPIMRERAENMTAQLEIASRPGQGTVLSVTWPKPAEDK